MECIYFVFTYIYDWKLFINIKRILNFLIYETRFPINFVRKNVQRLQWAWTSSAAKLIVRILLCPRRQAWTIFISWPPTVTRATIKCRVYDCQTVYILYNVMCRRWRTNADDRKRRVDSGFTIQLTDFIPVNSAAECKNVIIQIVCVIYFKCLYAWYRLTTDGLLSRCLLHHRPPLPPLPPLGDVAYV